MKLISLLPLALFLFPVVPVLAFKVEPQTVPSKAMNKPVNVNVILPDNYAPQGKAWPVLYLLHGAGDDGAKWLSSTSIGALADQYGILVVCPDAQMSWYFDSPIDPKIRYETFVSGELVRAIDARYHTAADRNHRAIAGNSMGGHGALFLAIRHQDVFSIAVALSGGVDFRPFPENWNLKNLLGTFQKHPENWNELVVANQAKKLKDGDLAIALDCGTSDFFLGVNRALHQQLLDQKVSHDYTERPGDHGWAYWSNAIKYQMLFISLHFKQADSAKP